MDEELIGKIAAADRAVGWMALQMHSVAQDGRWYPALASLFILVEQVLRWATDAPGDLVLERVIQSALTAELIDEDEAATLNVLRDYRNKYLHANFHELAVESNGLIYPINDEEAAQVLYELMGTSCLTIIKKLVTADAIEAR